MLSKILEHYGREHQIDKLAEELLELALEILRRKDRGMEGLLGEYADVKVLMGQIDLALTPEEAAEVERWKEHKIDRQINRISKEYANGL